MRVLLLPPRLAPLPLFLSLLVLSIFAHFSFAKGRTSSPSSAASAYTLDLHHPYPNQRIYAVSDSAGDVFLTLKCASYSGRIYFC